VKGESSEDTTTPTRTDRGVAKTNRIPAKIGNDKPVACPGHHARCAGFRFPAIPAVVAFATDRAGPRRVSLHERQLRRARRRRLVHGVRPLGATATWRSRSNPTRLFAAQRRKAALDWIVIAKLQSR